MCEAQCRELLRRQHQRSGVADKVRDLLLRQPHAMPTMEQIAHHFCMSSRTLRRHLLAEGVSYRLLSDDFGRRITQSARFNFRRNSHSSRLFRSIQFFTCF